PATSGAPATSPAAAPDAAPSTAASPRSAPSTQALPAAPAGSTSGKVENAATTTNPADPTSVPSKVFTPRPGAPTPKWTPPAPKPPTGTGWLTGVPHGSNTPGPMDPRCMTGRVICIDMSTKTLLWVVDGKPQYGMDVRFGDENNPTRKGKFDIYMKMKDCVSTIYHTPMPDAMFFSGGEAVHFSIDFKTYGYAHHSHGCVNVRDRAAVDRLFADTRVGDTVIVY
ncbi:L,D-transpeptidase, partial [Catenulispora subtropica]|uniref:L,D-transpeptidase n=1 Tax=Catenulispora subtropica TaxID=450798 RepID=UPI0031D540D4